MPKLSWIPIFFSPPRTLQNTSVNHQNPCETDVLGTRRKKETLDDQRKMSKEEVKSSRESMRERENGRRIENEGRWMMINESLQLLSESIPWNEEKTKEKGRNSSLFVSVTSHIYVESISLSLFVHLNTRLLSPIQTSLSLFSTSECFKGFLFFSTTSSFFNSELLITISDEMEWLRRL